MCLIVTDALLTTTVTGTRKITNPDHCVNIIACRDFHSFVKRWTPITTMSMFGLLSMCGVLSWLGILSRSYFSSFSLKLLICYAFSVPLFVCGLNLLNLVKYMPKTKGARRLLQFDFVLNQCWVGVQING
jgi:hypothetical protein